jgi:hypothetical protein
VHHRQSIADKEERPDDHDVELAVRVVRTHVPQSSLGEPRCHNCGWPFPCVTRNWAAEVLTDAGWGAAEIAAPVKRDEASEQRSDER